MAEPAIHDHGGAPARDRETGVGAVGQSDRSATADRRDPAPTAAPYELSVVIPTFNERDNIGPLLEVLDQCLAQVAWEAIFVDDDSPDRTAARVREHMPDHPNVRCIHRIGRRGLSSACIEGMLAASAPYLAVLDADLQHDLGILPLMLHKLKRDQLEIVIGSRYVDGGGTGDWAQSRVRISAWATRLARRLLRADLSDPMSGFFVLDRRLMERSVRRVTGKGFKILLDIFLSADGPVRFAEMGYVMRSRARGASKLDALVAWEFFALLMDKFLGRFIPIRFIMFVSVGLIGGAGHLVVLGLLTQMAALPFAVGQSIATLVAMTINFFFNNMLTYRDRQLHGWGFAKGLASFYVACGLGAFINVVVAQFLYGNDISWWISGLLGALIGAVWNFTITSSFTWKRPGKETPDADSAGRGPAS